MIWQGCKFNISFLILLFLFCNEGESQVKKNSFIIFSDLDSVNIGSRDSVQARNIVIENVNKQIDEGFLLCSMDSIVEDSVNRYIHLYKGTKYYGLAIGNYDSLEILNIGKLQKLSPNDWRKFVQQVIKTDNNNGYPLSKMKLIPVYNNSDTLTANIIYEKGPRFFMGEIDGGDNKVISNLYLSRLVNAKKGSVFQHDHILNIDKILSKINYLEVEFPPRIKFEGNQVNINMYLKRKPSNSFDFLIGFNNSGSGLTRSVQITGQANMDLNNSLKLGERIFMHYENLQPSSPRFNLVLDFPYLAWVPFGITFGTDLIKSKDQYINIQSFSKFTKAIDPQSFIKLVFHNNFSYVLNADSVYIRNFLKLPTVIDFNHNSYGAEYSRDTRDNRVSPSKGYDCIISGRIGLKKFIASDAILRYDVDNTLIKQLDSLNQNKLQYNFSVQGSYYYMIVRRSVLKLGLQSDIILNKAGVLENEVIKIGGIRNLRGFNDNFFSSDKFVISTFEYRFLLDRFSYLNIFVDHGYMSLISQDFKSDWKNYIGLGLGMQLQTKAGAFGIFFASSRTEETDFDFSALKVHFGYLAKF
ncbi:MAG: BamA/TamA family outer membrane protein [Saprospiraceae bacterium]|nr:BamA/TamA family outer membrane protein [Saprospiraceae bacterium]